MKPLFKDSRASLVLAISGMGGLLYGVDIGVIDPALRYLNRSIQLSESELSAIVAAVLAGSVLGSIVAGVLADWLGRKRMMIGSGLIFVASVGVIFASQSFASLMVGRLLQGASGGLIAVVVPLYLAECLSANVRGRGAAIFQFMLTVGIVLAAFVGSYYTTAAEREIALAAGNAARAAAASDDAWRGMFLAVVYPGILFLVGTFLLPESPRWLVLKGEVARAKAALRLLRSDESFLVELDEIRRSITQQSLQKTSVMSTLGEIFSTKRYVLPFILSCAVLGFCQATGINSMLQYMTTILQKAGLDPVTSSLYGTGIKVLNAVVTIAAIYLVERKGRVFLLSIGTAGIAISLAVLSITFHTFESQRIDIKAEVAAMVREGSLDLNLENLKVPGGGLNLASGVQVSVLIRQGDKQILKEAFMAAGAVPDETAARHVLRVPRLVDSSQTTPYELEILRAEVGPIPSPLVGLLSALCIGLFIASFSIGPGVCVWLALSELMPNRIRSVGMGIALLINQGISTLIALTFLPIAGQHGFHAMFAFWAVCTTMFFVVVRAFLPETRGRSLEEIEKSFS
ncbi:hypothetical protein CDN99_08145 [Roseateles aquatilis]|uniref:Major facilitator superfamily (MFS) profile domain-containing protein n=1 Tax=Roseateles aquatilis TaxID=431061 RepID=A0A246JI61_9BURK|nr:MFS transporter [Roseateles aquatilis]OWQ92348.1 hypothetical protein CDN99_08145 [Roseateles aquatilis]